MSFIFILILRKARFLGKRFNLSFGIIQFTYAMYTLFCRKVTINITLLEAVNHIRLHVQDLKVTDTTLKREDDSFLSVEVRLNLTHIFRQSRDNYNLLMVMNRAMKIQNWNTGS